MAIRIWSEEARAFVEPEDILACGADGVYYSVPQIDAPAADGAWGRVWPEKLWIIKNGICQIPFNMYESLQNSDKVTLVRTSDSLTGIASINQINTAGCGTLKVECSGDGIRGISIYVGSEYVVFKNVEKNKKIYTKSGIAHKSGYIRVNVYGSAGRIDVYNLWFE